MQELEVKLKNAELDIIDKEAFESNINAVVKKYANYQVTAATIRDDKQTLADLRKLTKQINDKRIEIKKEITQPVTDFEKYVKKALTPINEIIIKINTDIQTYEQHQRAIRLDTVKAYIANKCADYMLDPRIFDELANDYTRAGDFKANGLTLKKKTTDVIDNAIIEERKRQNEIEKASKLVSATCEENNLTDTPYLRQLRAGVDVVELLDIIRQDAKTHEEELKKAQEPVKQTKEVVDTETGEIVEVEEESAVYTQHMTLDVYFKDSDDKDRFKRALSNAGFNNKVNYLVTGYRKIDKTTQEELEEEWSSNE